MDRLKLLLWTALVLLLLLLLSPFIPSSWERPPKMLYPRYDREKVSSIRIETSGFTLEQQNHSWMLYDDQGGSWPVNSAALDRLLDFPVYQWEHLVIREDAPIHEQISYYKGDEELLQISLVDSSLGMLLIDEGDQVLHSFTQEIPGLHLNDYLDLQPLKDLSPSHLIRIELDTDLPGETASYFQYTLYPLDSLWYIHPGDLQLDETLMRTYLSDLISLKAHTLLDGELVDIPRERFQLMLEDDLGGRWTLAVGDSINIGSSAFWPVRVNDNPYLYLFEQEELKKIARSTESFFP